MLVSLTRHPEVFFFYLPRVKWHDSVFTYVPLGRNPFSAGLGIAWDSTEELAQVVEERVVWVTLPRLLPPRPDPG